MRIHSWVVGSLATNCYVVVCDETDEALVIDPGFSAEETNEIRRIVRGGFKIRKILNTHGHVDHISGNSALKKLTGADIVIHEFDASMLIDPPRNLSYMLGRSVVSPEADRLVKDDDILEVGALKLRVIHTPGHTRGSISLLCEAENVVFTGDTLFAGSIGRTDLPGSSFRDIMHSLRERLRCLPDETVVYPGHGESTTIGREKRMNPFLSSRREDLSWI
jgi:glyoxylase-like metal-dependent hydrolase (beta-lactamase superfamily II)